MIRLFNGQPDLLGASELEAAAEMMSALAEDLVGLRQGDMVGADHADRIDAWRIKSRDVLCVRGRISGHPRIEGPGCTARGWVIDMAAGWLLTTEGFWRISR